MSVEHLNTLYSITCNTLYIIIQFVIEHYNLCITLAIGTILWNNNNSEEHKKNNNEHNEGFLGEIRNSIMSKIWSIVP